MSTEALNLDQAVERFMAPVEEPAVEETTDSQPVEAEEVEEVTEDDSEVEQVEETYDTDEDETESEYEEPDDTGPETYTVKVDGQEVEVSIDDLKRSYSGQGKIQKGMQEAAEARKQAQQMAEQAAYMAQQLSQLHQQVQETGFIAPPQEPSQELFNSDPIGYMEAKINYDNQLKQFNAQQQQIQQARQYEQQMLAQQQQAMLQNEVALIREKIPELADPNKANQLREDLLRYGQEYGFNDQELGAISDHRAMLVLRDAMMWRKSQSKRSVAEKKVEGTRPVIKPGAKKTANPSKQKLQQSKSKLKKTGSIEDALSLIMDM